MANRAKHFSPPRPNARFGVMAVLLRASSRPLVPFVVLTVMLAALAAQAGSQNRVLKVDVEGSGENRLVRIHTAAEPTFTVFRLSDPMRVVVDISGGDLSTFEGPLAIEDGLVDQVAFRQFSADGFLIGRVIVGFDRNLTYDVQAEGRSVVIRTGQLPGSTVDRAAPPPIAPVDRAAAERYELARRDADAAAARALEERRRAEEAAAYAQTQQREAERMASEAERTKQDAVAAKKEAEALRRKAAEALARDRSNAEKAASDAEKRLAELQRTVQEMAQARAEADRVAAEAERSRRDAEETAAEAEARHKSRVAELEEQIALAQQEKKAAKTARQRAENAKKEAVAAQRAADAARSAAEKTRAETTEKLTEIARREKLANNALARIAGERREVAAEREKVAKERQRIEADRQSVEDNRRAVASKEEELEKRARELTARQQEFASREATLTAERDQVSELQHSLEAARRRLTADRGELQTARQRLATERTRLTENRKGSRRSKKETQRELAQLEKERRRLENLQRRIDDAQATVDADQQKLARAQKALRKVEAQRDRLAADRKELARERAILDAKRDSIAEARDALKRERRAIRRERKKIAAERRKAEKIAVESLVSPERNTVTVASSRSTATDASRKERRGPSANLRGVRRIGDGVDSGVLLLLDQNPTFEVQRIEDPPRLVIDLADTDRSAARLTYGVNSPFIRRVRLGDHGSVTRVVMDLSAETASHRVVQTDEGLLVRMDPPPGSTVTAGLGGPAGAPGDTSLLRDVRFTGGREAAAVILDIDNATIARVDDRSTKAWVLELRGAKVKKALERSLDTSAYGSVVRLVSTYQASSDPDVVKVVANLAGPASYDLKRKNGSLVWSIKGRARPTAVASAATPQTAGFAAEAAVVSRSTPTQTRRSKKRVSIDLKDADIVNVIRLIAEISGENIITGDDISGKVTLRLRNVPWDKALDTILKSKGYDRVRSHNIIRIAPASKLQEERERAIANKKQKDAVEDTVIKMITVNYATASEIVSQLKPLLSGRGSVQTDDRTNTIIVEDIKSNVGRLVELTRRLDKQTPQVLIEARIVEASSNNLAELGIQWGGTGQMAARAGNPTGLTFPGDVIATGAADDLQGNATGGISDPGRFAVNLPAPIGAGAGGGIGFIFGSAGGSQLLQLRLSALEDTGQGRIISSPRITTLDNKTAKIAQGIDIPITVVSAAGANTRFIPANLELEVTPHVTNDGSVLMKIKTSKNEPNFTRTGANGDPTIEKKFAETEVLVPDGDTTVIGGIYTRSTSESYAKVPFFGDIPVLGWLFKKKRSEVRRAELLVFITPRIVNREQSMVTAGPEMKGTKQK